MPETQKARIGLALRGVPKSPAHILAQSQSHRGTKHPPASSERKLKLSDVMKISAIRGESHYRWNPNREIVKRNLRNDGAYKQWVIKVKKRDNGICRLKNENCFGYMVVHHILSWSEYLKERYIINNGITLCQHHHPIKRADEQRLIPTFQRLVGSYIY